LNGIVNDKDDICRRPALSISIKKQPHELPIQI
jgi:hypothetical protein